ncbi:MAG: TetR/AcrR family transcriptional regulator [Anaerovoracaceae bacterium]
MQIQKAEIKNRITNSAIESFLTLGYEKASMRRIASDAGITVGNIYSYFSNKEELFDTIVLPTVEQIKGLILMKLSTNNRITKQSAMEATNQIMNTILTNHQVFLILMDGAKGSKYENIKGVIKIQIKERLVADLIPQLHMGKENEILIDTLSSVLLDGIINIVIKSENDQRLMNKLICNFLLLVFEDIAERLN